MQLAYLSLIFLFTRWRAKQSLSTPMMCLYSSRRAELTFGPERYLCNKNHTIIKYRQQLLWMFSKKWLIVLFNFNRSRYIIVSLILKKVLIQYDLIGMFLFVEPYIVLNTHSFISASLITAMFLMVILSRSLQSLNYLCISRWMGSYN